MSDARRLCLVAGAGPGLGKALLQRFAAGGYVAVGLGRATRADSVDVRPVDLASPKPVNAIVRELIGHYGPPVVVIHNPSRLYRGAFVETPLDAFEDASCNMALSAAILVQAAIPAMVRSGGGTFLVSGATASLRGGSGFSAFASAKFALRGLAQSLAREFQSSGVHVAHVVLDGIIDTPASRTLHNRDPGRMMRPDEIAESYWHLAHHPRSTWTQELHLRPVSEVF